MVNRGAVREYVNGSLWVWPGISAVAALLVGFTVSQIDVTPGSPLAPLAFQGTADDARTLLGNVTGTVVTVIALVLGLTVVALQLSSTQFSPRLLRKFLRDRANQVVAQRVRRHVRVLLGRAVHGRPGSRGPGRAIPAARDQRGDRVAVCQHGHGR